MPISFSDLGGGGGGAGGNGFSLIVGSSGNTTYAFSTPQPAGAYSFTSELADKTFDIYLISADNTNVGYASATSALEASGEFNRVVLYGATTNDIINFEFKPSPSPATSGDVVDGAAPFLTSATPVTLASVDDSTTVTGGNFASDVEIVFTGQDDVDRPAKNIVRSSSTSLIVTRPDAFPVEQEPYSMTATNAGIPNPSVVVNKLTDYFDAGGGITWVTGTTLPTANPDVAYSTTLSATDADGGAVSYAIISGSLPSGFSFNESTGVISGTSSTVAGYSFIVRATDLGQNTADRTFSLSVAPPLVVDYLVIAGGGGGASAGGGNGGGGGGGGGIQYLTNQTLVGASTYAVTLGAGGGSNTIGSASSFNGATANGGGRGSGLSAGLGGGGGAANGSGGSSGGFPGAGGTGPSTYSSIGVITSSGQLSGALRYFSGGGGGGSAYNSPGGAGGIGGGGFGGNTNSPGAGAGAVNTGGGGGGGGGSGFAGGGTGGSGIVIFKYPTDYTITIGAGLTGETYTSGGSKYTKITSGTGNVSWA